MDGGGRKDATLRVVRVGLGNVPGFFGLRHDARLSAASDVAFQPWAGSQHESVLLGERSDPAIGSGRRVAGIGGRAERIPGVRWAELIVGDWSLVIVYLAHRMTNDQ